MDRIDKVFQKLRVQSRNKYKTDPKPMVERGEDGRIRKVITAGDQIRVVEKETGKNQVFSPVLYQSCMDTDNIILKTLLVQRLDDTHLVLDNGYVKQVIDCEKNYLETANWDGKIQKKNCTHCTNCGRCSW